jgi:uncharacterized protein (TIGR04255 family)
VTVANPGRDIPLEDPVSFDAPPVSEVVLGVQFSGSVADDALALADFWPQIRDEFPTLERREALDPIDEDFGTTPPAQQVQISLGVEPRRYWFVSVDGHWLVQVQHDRFIFNWRRQGDEEIKYPRYRTIRRRFEELFRIFAAAVGDELLAANSPNWCAITYVNHIVAADPGSAPSHMPLSRILRTVASPKSSVLPTLEDTIFQQRHLLPPSEPEQAPGGRLYIKANPVVRANDRIPGYALELRVLARPDGKSRAAVMRCFDQGRDLIVRSFKDITTPAMHKQWGLQESK